MRKKQLQNILFNTSILLITFIFMNICISSTLFIFKVSITKINCIVSLMVTIILFGIYKFVRKAKIKESVTSILLFLVLVIVSIAISGNIYDLSWDGNSYHKTAIGGLKNGWNPVYENIEEFNESDNNEQKVILTHKIWNNHYPKGAWIFSANIYSLTENIESGKAINVIMLFATLLMTFSYLVEKMNSISSIILSVLIALNPVSVAQIFTYYNDGLIYSYIITLIIVLLNLINEKENNFLNYSLIVVILSSLINIKFTGFAYAGITTLFFYLYVLLNKEQRKQKIIKLTIAGVISLIIGVILIGYSTYIKNFIDHGHPFYPLFGKEKIDIMTNNQPREFENMNRIKKFLLANFSESNNITYDMNERVTLKIPFTISKNEFAALKTSDLRIGGFGVFASGIFVISGIVIIIGMYYMFFKDKIIFYKIFTLLSLLAFLIIILEESWWARYLPQLYIIPFIAIYLLYYFKERKFNNIINGFLILLLILNVGLFIKCNTLYRIDVSYITKREINTLDTENTLNVYTKSFNGATYNLYDKKLKLNIIDNIENYENEKYEKKSVYGGKLMIYKEKEKEA